MRLTKNDHTIETSIATEAVQLKAKGYREVVETPTPVEETPIVEDAPKPRTRKSQTEVVTPSE